MELVWTVGNVMCGAGIVCIFIIAYLSHKENHPKATAVFITAAVFTLVAFCSTIAINSQLSGALGLLAVVVAIGISLFRFPTYSAQHPNLRYDERDVMFSRCHLVAGSERYEGYYRSNPEKKELDDSIRSLPGLLSTSSLYYHAADFEKTRSNFKAITELYSRTDATPNPDAPKADQQSLPFKNKNNSELLNEWLKKEGAHSAGFTKLRPNHLYSVKGRRERYAQPIAADKSFPNAIAFTVEMNYERVAQAPASPIVLESSTQYLNSAQIAVDLVEKISEMGYSAKAHIDGDYEVICPLVARDAGLGEIGRMGLLMDPVLGPRCRIAVVTTDLPLDLHEYVPNAPILYFCEHCKQCAKSCPSQAISYDQTKGSVGSKRWTIDHEKCFETWCKFGTDCGKCMAVCPYSHRNNRLHNSVRKLVRISPAWTRIAIKMDNWLYH